YFLLAGRVLFYGKDKPENISDMSIDKSISLVGTSLNLMYYNRDKSKGRFVFTLVTKDRDFELACTNEFEGSLWIAALKKAQKRPKMDSKPVPVPPRVGTWRRRKAPKAPVVEAPPPEPESEEEAMSESDGAYDEETSRYRGRKAYDEETSRYV
ncbi:hypothetical protein KIPB_012418, partial [Kipferlia bialata]